MPRSYPLTDYEKHIVRETPELGWDAETTTEAQDSKPLPIDMPVGKADDPEPWLNMTPVCWAASIGFALAIIAAFAILWVVYG